MRFGLEVSPINNLSIEVCPRVHLGLISMHAGANRKNGGVGFALDGPRGIVSVNHSRILNIVDERSYGFSPNELTHITERIQQIAMSEGLSTLVEVRLRGPLATHIGMGSGTAFRLAILEALFLANGRALTKADLVRYSGRGGTSGIGINTYFSGGLVFDLGIHAEDATFVPSSHTVPTNYPLTIASLPMPAWPLCICVPNWLPSKTQEQELEFFQRVTPLAAPDSFEASYHALFGVYASVAEANFSNFCLAVEAMQQVRWKQLEWLEYGASLFDLRDTLRQLGAECIGMSSLGPMLFCFGQIENLRAIRDHGQALNCRITLTTVSNEGREIKSAVDA